MRHCAPPAGQAGWKVVPCSPACPSGHARAPLPPLPRVLGTLQRCRPLFSPADKAATRGFPAAALEYLWKGGNVYPVTSGFMWSLGAWDALVRRPAWPAPPLAAFGWASLSPTPAGAACLVPRLWLLPPLHEPLRMLPGGASAAGAQISTPTARPPAAYACRASTPGLPPPTAPMPSPQLLTWSTSTMPRWRQQQRPEGREAPARPAACRQAVLPDAPVIYLLGATAGFHCMAGRLFEARRGG